MEVASKEPNPEKRIDSTTDEEKVVTITEPKTGVSLPTKLNDGKVLNSMGIRKKSVLGIGIKIYGFGMILSSVFILIYLVLAK